MSEPRNVLELKAGSLMRLARDTPDKEMKYQLEDAAHQLQRASKWIGEILVHSSCYCPTCVAYMEAFGAPDENDTRKDMT